MRLRIGSNQCHTFWHSFIYGRAAGESGRDPLPEEGSASTRTMFSGLIQYLVVARTNESGGFHASDPICLPSCKFHNSVDLLVRLSSKQVAVEFKGT